MPWVTALPVPTLSSISPVRGVREPQNTTTLPAIARALSNLTTQAQQQLGNYPHEQIRSAHLLAPSARDCVQSVPGGPLGMVLAVQPTFKAADKRNQLEFFV